MAMPHFLIDSKGSGDLDSPSSSSEEVEESSSSSSEDEFDDFFELLENAKGRRSRSEPVVVVQTQDQKSTLFEPISESANSRVPSLKSESDDEGAVTDSDEDLNTEEVNPIWEYTMADRLTQLQDAVNQQAENFCNSIGILQQQAISSKFPDRNAPPNPNNVNGSTEDYTQTFASLIARCAKDIDYLIESLPSEESSTELQLSSLRRLEQENTDVAQRLREVIVRGEALLERIQSALSDISQSQIDMQRLDLNSEPQVSSKLPFSI